MKDIYRLQNGSAVHKLENALKSEGKNGAFK